MENAIILKVTVEYTIENTIDIDSFKNEFNNDPYELYKYISNEFKDDPTNFSSDAKIVMIKAEDNNSHKLNKYNESYIKNLWELYKKNCELLTDADNNFFANYFISRHSSSIDRSELWEILVSLSVNKISLAEAHNRIVNLAKK